MILLMIIPIMIQFLLNGMGIRRLPKLKELIMWVISIISSWIPKLKIGDLSEVKLYRISDIKLYSQFVNKHKTMLRKKSVKK